MRFRPCIDIHNGKVKQIVGESLADRGNGAKDNFISDKDAAFYAEKYRNDGFKGGHIILLNPVGSEYYEADLEQARLALAAFPNGMQIGGGITSSNAVEFLDMGASHVIVTSYVFRNGIIDYERLESVSTLVDKNHLVLDLSCRKKGNDYFVVTDRWQKMTNEKLNSELFSKLSTYCDEFLVHAVDVEGKSFGIDDDVLKILGECGDCTITYAGGIHNMEDISKIEHLGNGRVDFTIGSALDLFGGSIPYTSLLKYC